MIGGISERGEEVEAKHSRHKGMILSSDGRRYPVLSPHVLRTQAPSCRLTRKLFPRRRPLSSSLPNANEYAWRRFGAKTGEVPGGLQRIRKLSICLDVHVHFHLFALQRDEAGTLIRLTNNTGRDQIKSAPVADPDEQGHVEER